MNRDHNSAYEAFLAEERAIAANPKPRPAQRMRQPMKMTITRDEPWSAEDSEERSTSRYRYLGYLACFVVGFYLQNGMSRIAVEDEALLAFDSSKVSTLSVAHVRTVNADGSATFSVKATVKNDTAAPLISYRAACAIDTVPSTQAEPNYAREPRLFLSASGVNIGPGQTAVVDVQPKMEFEATGYLLTPASLPKYRCVPMANSFDRDGMLKAVRR